MAVNNRCLKDGCSQSAVRFGLCDEHYRNLTRPERRRIERKFVKEFKKSLKRRLRNGEE